MQIRIATTEDSAGIAKVQVDSYRSAYVGIYPPSDLDALSIEVQEAEWKGWKDKYPDDVVYVAESDKGGVIAYALARPGESGIPGYDGELIALHVRSKDQRMGIGRLMLWMAAKGLRRAKCESMMLWTFEANPSNAFYEHLGATLLDVRKESASHPLQVSYGWPEIERVWKQGTTI